MRKPAELVLGGVQLGLAYGAANRTGKPSRASALRLVRRAADSGISSVDTARAYGDSEERLGHALIARKSVRAITKLSPLAHLPADASRRQVRAAVDSSIEESLDALKRQRIDCLLLHRAAHMTAHDGVIWERLIERLGDGTLLSLGVSVQSPLEAKQALECPEVRHIQLPFNLLDWRWREAGVIVQLLANPHVTVHARSVFLQGLLANDNASVWPEIEGVTPAALIESMAKFVRAFRRVNAADLCLAYVRAQSWIDGVVVGMETEEQLENDLGLFVRPPLSLEQCAQIEHGMPRVPETLLDPSRWPNKPA